MYLQYNLSRVQLSFSRVCASERHLVLKQQVSNNHSRLQVQLHINISGISSLRTNRGGKSKQCDMYNSQKQD